MELFSYRMDNPIENSLEDFLQRGLFVESVEQLILAVPKDESFILGITGEFGIGKTSVKNLLLSRFREKSDYLVVDFAQLILPTLNGAEEEITKSFYKAIIKSCDDYINSSIINKFSKALIKIASVLSLIKTSATSIISTFLKLVASIFRYDVRTSLGSKSNFDKIVSLKNETSRHLKKIDTPLICLIDEIDHYPIDAIYHLLSLIKSNSDISNLICLVFFDYETCLEELLKKRTKYSLERLIPFNIQIPAIPEQAISDYFWDIFYQSVNEQNLTLPTYFHENLSSYNLNISDLLKTIRSVKRFYVDWNFRICFLKNEGKLHEVCIAKELVICLIEFLKKDPGITVYDQTNCLDAKSIQSILDNSKLDRRSQAFYRLLLSTYMQNYTIIYLDKETT